MLDGMVRLLPTAEVGFLGMIRDEESLTVSTYADRVPQSLAGRLPEDLSGRQCYVLDPMLATGGTLAAAIRFLVDRGADDQRRPVEHRARRGRHCLRQEYRRGLGVSIR